MEREVGKVGMDREARNRNRTAESPTEMELTKTI